MKTGKVRHPCCDLNSTVGDVDALTAVCKLNRRRRRLRTSIPFYCSSVCLHDWPQMKPACHGAN